MSTVGYKIEGRIHADAISMESKANESIAYLRDRCREFGSATATITLHDDDAFPASYVIEGDLCLDDFESICDFPDILENILDDCKGYSGEDSTLTLAVPERMTAAIEMLHEFLSEDADDGDYFDSGNITRLRRDFNRV